MAIKITNSLTKEKEPLIPIQEDVVNMYSCGVTVYDKCHIGHARSLYIFDVISRHLKNRKYQVNFVRNITDVDDKIINKANQLGKSFEDVVQENIALYQKDVENLKVNFADVEPKATENIQEMIQHIEALIANDKAYAVEGDVYFKVRSFADYGKLSGQSAEKMLEGVRIDPDAKKKDSLDFCLWKKAKEGEPAWESPWGLGRPGWHIECSAMSMKYLKCETLDIHAGGRDLIFPHHENEIAQSEALTGKPFAKYWIHHGLLKINGQKMAKSLGNFITLDEVLEKFSHNVLKLFYLQSHYASEIDFSWEKMAEVKKTFDRIALCAQKLQERSGTGSGPRVLNPASRAEAEAGQAWVAFLEKMDDDFNTPQALSVLFDFLKKCNALLEGDEKAGTEEYQTALEVLLLMAEAFGFDFQPEEESVSGDVQALLQERIAARQAKDFQRSDEIRDALKAQGILVEDGKDGQTWRRM